MHSHNHSHDHSHGRSSDASKRIGWAFFLNVVFTIIEFIGGWRTNSTAIRGPAGKSVGFSHFEHKRLILFNIMAPCLTGRWLYNDDGNPYQCDQSPRDVPTGERHSVNNTQPEESNAQIYARIGSISATCRRWVKRQQPRK